MEDRTYSPLLRAKFHLDRWSMSPVRVQKPENRPVSKRNTGRAALRADPAGNKPAHYFPPHLKYVAALPLGIQKFKFVVELPKINKTCIVFVKNKSFIHMAEWIGYCYYHNSYSNLVYTVCSHTHARLRPRHSSIALSMTLWSIPRQTCFFKFLIA